MTTILLPHMDDEVFLIPYLVELSEDMNCEVSIFFLTKSEGRGHKYDQTVREKESERAISQILPHAKIEFLGKKFNVDDLELHKSLTMHYEYLKQILSENCDTLVSPYFEGGHIDHDSSCILTNVLAKELGCRHLTFHLYSARTKKGHLFRVAKPCGDVSSVSTSRISSGVYRNTVLIPFRYRSQFLTWLGLYPGLVSRTLLLRKFVMQDTYDFDFSKPPNFGKILYENKRDGSYAQWKFYVTDFLQTVKSDQSYE
jgi:hypothetical protein